MMRYRTPILFVTAVFTAVFGAVEPISAQTVDDTPEQRNRADAALEQRRQGIETFTPGSAAPDPGPAQAAGGLCFDIDRLTVRGVEHYPPSNVAEIVDDYVPGCLQGADIQAIMRRLDALYVENGFITTKTYIPPQNLLDGHLELEVIEGKVESAFLIDADGLVEGRKANRQFKHAFPGVKPGSLFQLRDFEQGLDQMNRLKSVDAKMRLQPGTEVGGSAVLVQRLQENRVRGTVNYDNKGSKSTGLYRVGFDLEVDDLLGRNDAFSFDYTGSENTNALDTSLEVPFGYATARIAASYSEYLVQISPDAELFGRSGAVSLGYDYMLRRDQVSTTELRFTLERSQSERFINNAELTPQNLTTLGVGVTHIRQTQRGRVSYSADLVQGLPIFGVDEDGSGDRTVIPQAQFTLIEAGVYRVASVRESMTWVSDLQLQWSPDALFSSERLSLGSSSTIRGYDAALVAGDSGAYWRNDLYFAPQSEFLQKIGPSAFFDVGFAHDRANDEIGWASGVGVGASWNWGRMTVSGTVAVPLIEDNAFDAGGLQIEASVDLAVF